MDETAGAAGSARLPDFAAEVLDVVDAIPKGRVMTYGDIAELVGRGGPRQVGQVMSHWGGAVPWWRVLRADGSPPQGHETEAVRHYRRERTPLRPDGRRVDLRLARWAGPSDGGPEPRPAPAPEPATGAVSARSRKPGLR